MGWTKLTLGGLELIEIAPGVDVQRDILAQMETHCKISDDVKVMDGRIFREELMNIKSEMIDPYRTFSKRYKYNADANIMYLDFAVRFLFSF